MQVIISGHHVELTDALRDYVNEKMERLERHSDQISNVQVTLNVEKQRQEAEASLIFQGTKLFAEAQQDDMYAAIDLMTDKLDRQLLKRKEKTVDRAHGNHH